MILLWVIGTAFAAAIVSTLFNTYKNYTVAKGLGLPTRITFTSPLNPIFMIAGKDIREWFRVMPWPLSEVGKYCYYGWGYDDSKVHEELGPAWINSSSWGNDLVIADPDALVSLLTRWRQCVKRPGIEAMAILGPNVDTVEGDDWSRHRRLTAPCFNERSSSLVWEESLRQASGMLQNFLSAGKEGSDQLGRDTQTIALHILTRVAFGVQNTFGEGVSKIVPGYQYSLRDALHIVLGHLSLVLAAPLNVLMSPVMPASWRQVGVAITEYTGFVGSILDKEREKMKFSQEPSSSLISVLLRASESEKASGDSKQSMSDAEILGNIFIFNVAGHDTTANTLSFAIGMLAAYPEVQDWLSEEINSVLGDTDNLDYETTYPKLTRCLATLYETLRLFAQVPENPKWSGDNYVPLTIGKREIMIPPKTLLTLNTTAVQTSTKYWGPEAHIWQPKRWIVSPSTAIGNTEPSNLTAKPETVNPQGESIMEPRRGIFMPWSDGPRNCPGQKFSRVEFVAVMIILFRKYRVRPQTVGTESPAQMKERVLAWVKDAQCIGVALKMKKPGAVRLIWEET